MSATDELRRMLDERGVEWTAPNSCLRDEMTSWAAGGFYYDAFEVPEPDGTFLLTASHQDDLTPEQAIAATLGDAFTREECEASFVHGYSLGTLPVGSDPQWDENRQTVDEHMAELGWVRAATLDGTCELEKLARDMYKAIVMMIAIPNYADTHRSELEAIDDRAHSLGVVEP